MSAAFPIEEDPRFRRYTATAGQTQFAVTFPFQQNEDIALLLVHGDGTSTEISQTLYTLIGANDAGGGMATFASGRSAGETIIVLGRAVLDRLSSIVTNGRFSSHLTDGEFDRSRIIQQEHARELHRAFKSPLGEQGLSLAEGVPDGSVLIKDGAYLKEGPDASDITNAQGYAEQAQAAEAAATAIVVSGTAEITIMKDAAQAAATEAAMYAEMLGSAVFDFSYDSDPDAPGYDWSE